MKWISGQCNISGVKLSTNNSVRPYSADFLLNLYLSKVVSKWPHFTLYNYLKLCMLFSLTCIPFCLPFEAVLFIIPQIVTVLVKQPNTLLKFLATSSGYFLGARPASLAHKISYWRTAIPTFGPLGAPGAHRFAFRWALMQIRHSLKWSICHDGTNANPACRFISA